MRALGYPVILAGVFLTRQAIVGRAKDSGTDAKDLALAFLSGDMSEVSSVFSRKGDAVNFPTGASEVATSPGGASLIEAAKNLGGQAKGYLWGATGPNYYDCSGLIWQAMRACNLYNGPRFTSSTFLSVAKQQGWGIVPHPVVGDIVLWPRKHMGVVTGQDQMYSARSRKSGISSSSISGIYPGSTPVYVRVSS